MYAEVPLPTTAPMLREPCRGSAHLHSGCFCSTPLVSSFVRTQAAEVLEHRPSGGMKKEPWANLCRARRYDLEQLAVVILPTLYPRRQAGISRSRQCAARDRLSPNVSPADLGLVAAHFCKILPVFPVSNDPASFMRGKALARAMSPPPSCCAFLAVPTNRNC